MRYNSFILAYWHTGPGTGGTLINHGTLGTISISNDVISGATQDIVIRYAGAILGNIDLDADTDKVVKSGDIKGDVDLGIDIGNDIYRDTAWGNVLGTVFGGANDVQCGAKADDLFEGGAGTDRLNGGKGEDTASYEKCNRIDDNTAVERLGPGQRRRWRPSDRDRKPDRRHQQR